MILCPTAEIARPRLFGRPPNIRSCDLSGQVLSHCLQTLSFLFEKNTLSVCEGLRRECNVNTSLCCKLCWAEFSDVSGWTQSSGIDYQVSKQSKHLQTLSNGSNCSIWPFPSFDSLAFKELWSSEGATMPGISDLITSCNLQGKSIYWMLSMQQIVWLEAKTNHSDIFCFFKLMQCSKVGPNDCIPA